MVGNQSLTVVPENMGTHSDNMQGNLLDIMRYRALGPMVTTRGLLSDNFLQHCTDCRVHCSLP